MREKVNKMPKNVTLLIYVTSRLSYLSWYVGAKNTAKVLMSILGQPGKAALCFTRRVLLLVRQGQHG